MIVKTTTESFSARAINEDEYPGINVEINGDLAVAAEHCHGDETGRVMIRIYSKDNEEPISVNWRTGEVTLPSEWIGVIKTERP